MSPQQLLVLLLLVHQSHQWVRKDEVDQYFFDRPMVVPAAESSFHNVFHEVDTKDGNTPMYAKIGVAWIDDQFTFSATWIKENEDPKESQMSFYSVNTADLTDYAFFLLHADVIRIERTEYNEKDNLETLCYERRDKVFEKRLTDPSKLGALKDKKYEGMVVRFKSRILMMYKGKGNKCIGTYDTDVDTFTCLDTTQTPHKRIKEPGFLYHEDGSWARAQNTLEVFCRSRYKWNKAGELLDYEKPK